MKATENEVVICGGGLAGLCLARQLRLTQPNRIVTVLEKETGTLPDSIVKVGESTIEVGAYYLGEVLGLAEYIQREHLEKLGLRYFYPAQDFAERPEIGVANYLPAHSYQLDRGRLENYLRAQVVRDGVQLITGASIQDIQLSEKGEPHEVTYHSAGETHRITGRWLVDAMGRRRYLQRRLGLARELKTCNNSAWFRVKGRLSVDSFVPEENTAWHQRIKEPRWNSTCHLMGQGYWVWLIPLSAGNTSLGIVTDESYHPFNTFDRIDKAREWLAQNEPELAKRMDDYPLLDFKKIKGYSHTTSQVYSEQRWACVGDAGAFADPYYSVGTNMIAFANGFASELIKRDLEGSMETEYVDHANRYYLNLNDALTNTIQGSYRYHHHARVMAFKTIWDYYIGWTTTDPQFYHDIYLDPKKSASFSDLNGRIIFTQERIKQLFQDWAEAMSAEQAPGYGFIDYIEDLPTLRRLFINNLPPKQTRFRGVLKNSQEAANYIEDLAQVIFFAAVKDTMEHELARFETRWIEISAISLKPDRWEQDGLFRPQTKPRQLTYLQRELKPLLEPEGARPEIA